MTVRELREMLEEYPDYMEILIRTDHDGYRELNVRANVGILDYLGDNPIYGDDFSDFVYAALADHEEDPYDDEAINHIIDVYADELAPKLILE